MIAAVATAALGVARPLRGLATLDTRDDISAATASGDTALAQSLLRHGAKPAAADNNILLGATAAAGVTAIVLAVIADW